jgi:hypothetical protein
VAKPTLREQIGAACVHFTGIGDVRCKAGVPYASVRDASQAGPYRWPCISPCPWTGRTAATACERKRLPTGEEVEAEIRAFEELEAKLRG